jgi:hypothetical protein
MKTQMRRSSVICATLARAIVVAATTACVATNSPGPSAVPAPAGAREMKTAMTTASDALVTAYEAVVKENPRRRIGNITVDPTVENFEVVLIDLPEASGSNVGGSSVTVSRRAATITAVKRITVALSPYGGGEINATTISGRQAFDSALTALKGYENYDKEGRLTVEFAGQVYKVTFPLPPSQKVSRGPDYAYQVWVDVVSGQVVKVLVAG